jgi:hypothetical protein
VTFGTQENFRTENMQFKVANFEMAYNAFLRRPMLTKFMAIPHYAYLVLNRPGPNRVISIKGDVKCVYHYDRESYKMTDILQASAELKDLKKAFVESPPDLIMHETKTSKLSIPLEDKLSKVIPLSG